jgi:hypothetical protein
MTPCVLKTLRRDAMCHFDVVMSPSNCKGELAVHEVLGLFGRYQEESGLDLQQAA